MSIRTNIGARLAEGRQLLRAAYKEQDAAKLGVLRAGNTGIMSVDGEVAGSCHRVAHLRQLGIELEPPDDPSLIMFQVGTANEDIVYGDLNCTSSVGEVLLREEEIPIEWFTSNGTKVTGRPDMVICERRELGEEDEDIHFRHIPDYEEGYLVKPLLMLELKSVASVWTTRSVLFESDPKLAHLAQAAHYMWKLGTPGRLIYKQYANQAMPDFAHRFFPRQGKPGSEYLEYGKDGKPKCVRPFELVYALRFSETGALEFQREDTETPEEWNTSIVSTQDIERYYSYVSTMEAEQKLGSRPLTLGWEGKAKRFSVCSYCPLEDTCDRIEKEARVKPVEARPTPGEQYVQWLESARKLVIDRDAEPK